MPSSRFICLLILPAVSMASVGGKASAEFLSPVFRASIDDRNYDGVGDRFNTFHEGLLQNSNIAETRAVAEFDLQPYVGRDLPTTLLDLELSVNNDNGLQQRPYRVFLYRGDGESGLVDFLFAGVFVEEVTLLVPERSRRFSIDVTDELRPLLAEGRRYIGVRLHPLGENHFPTLLTNISMTIIPEPSAALLLTFGGCLLGVLGLRRRSRGNGVD